MPTTRRPVAVVLLSIFGILSLLSTATPVPVVDRRGHPPPAPVSKLDVPAYLGRWFQMYASFNVKYTFELGGNCVTADYGPTAEPGVLSVLNTVRPLLPFHAQQVRITGFAKQSPVPDMQGALSVVLGPGATEPAAVAFTPPGNYWIIRLGPIVNGKYDWAIVSDDTQSQLYVLTRDVDRFYTEYEDYVLELLHELGFTSFFNRPRETNQIDCNYDQEQGATPSGPLPRR